MILLFLMPIIRWQVKALVFDIEVVGITPKPGMIIMP